MSPGREAHIFRKGEAVVGERAKQIPVFLENKPGRLANVLSALARDKVNITALSVMDKHEHGVLRVVTDDRLALLGAARAALEIA